MLSDGPASDDERLQAFFTFDAGRQSEKILDSSINAVHGKRSLGVAFASNMSAGQNFVVCSSDSTRLLDGFYPFGGVWSGKGVDSAGNFNPLAANIGTNTLTYEITRTFGPVVKKFSAVREVTVLPSRHPTPIISQPGFFTLQVSTVASSYEWLKNDTLQSNGSRILALDGAGSYKVRVSDESGCFTGWSAPVTIESRPEGRVSQIGFATLEAVGDGNFFEWYKNDSLLEQATRRLIISAPGKYSMKAIDSFGNKSPLSIPTEAQFPTIPKIDRVDLFTLETDLNGERFEWYMNDSLIEFNSRSVKALQPGQYRVKVMDSLGTLSSMSDMFFNPDHWVYNHNSVGEQYTLAIRAGEDETVCPTATPFELNGSYPPGGTWTGKGVSADGIFIPSMDVAGTTQVVTYSITKSFGGLARTFASTKRISIEQVPSITGSSEIICNEEQVTLTANGGFPQYVWSSGDTTEVITINTPGEYWVEGQSSESCKVTSSPFMLRAENLPQPEIVHSKMLELESFIDLDTSENLSFIWMRNDTLLHETGAKLPAQKTGHYKSMVKSQLGCNSEFSEPFFFQSMVGLDEGIVLFPNPAKDFVNVGIFSKTERATITITSRRGIEVYHQEVLVHGTEMVFKIDISALHHKFYVVKVQTDAGFVSKKLLVAQGMQ